MTPTITKCEQIDSCLNILLDYDQPLRGNDLLTAVCSVLGVNSSIESFGVRRNYIVYKPATSSKSIVLLLKAITYLGHPHPLYKKRIQIPNWWQEFYKTYSSVYDIRFVGVYHYNGMIVFSDFDTTRYVQGMANNSSAHVYINDIFQAISYGVFTKEDYNGNIIKSISVRNFKKYLDDVMPSKHTEREEIFNVFRGFNSSFIFNTELKAKQAILEMKDGEWSKWREAEWCGFFLEYRVQKYLQENNVTAIVKYVQNKGNGLPDLDLYFPKSQFYGDLKASDMSNTEILGNDEETVLNCINGDGKVWYVVYEHETVKDIDVEGNPMTRFWNSLLGKDDRPLSYVSRMKNSVNFRKMSIYEINRANMNSVLSRFNQGRQQSGKSRNTKIKIKKREAENFIVFRG